MNDKDAQHERLEDLLRKAHLPEPSPHTKERITAAAKSAWNQAPPELPWLVPVMRLAASAAAAVVIIGLANFVSDRSLARWGAGMANQQPTEIEALPEMPYGPFVRRLASLDRRSSVIDASALNEHIEALRHILDEAQQSGNAKPPEPDSGRSDLILSPPSANSYS